MWWIGLHLPQLSLESFESTLTAQARTQPAALVDAHRIVAANAAAAELGVEPGQKRATALALAPQLLLGQADAWRDAQALKAVAHAALAFTPSVCLSEHHGVLLEVQPSVRYFGGRTALLKKLDAALAPLGHHVQVSSAPTAQGASLLSRWRQGVHCRDLEALTRTLDLAPLALLEAGALHAERLRGMGLRRIGDLRKLPRAGLARRFSEDLLDELDRAFGERPDPRVFVTLPEFFDSRLELFARADSTEQVLHGASVLLERLVAWLSAQHAFVRAFRLHMKHEPRWRRDDSTPTVTTLEVALAEPSRDATHLQVLLRERLAHLQLLAPTLELQLDADDIARKPPPNGELFPTRQSESEGLTRLIERLQARLGRERVQRLGAVEDHRPECATTSHDIDAGVRLVAGRVHAAASSCALPSRPVWLLPQAAALPSRNERPLFEGRDLHLLAGPERIESGWWDGALAERDYFIAQDDDGALLWLYRARLPLSETGEGEGWFLQGRFG
jgi:protein ImuB